MDDNSNRIDTPTPTGVEGPENLSAELPAGGTADAVDSAAVIAALTAERDQLAKERSDFYDQLLRRSADFDNFRRRAQRERADFAEFAGMEIMRSLVPVLDDFERALKTAASDKEYAKGMELIYNRLMDTLVKAGLEPMDVEGRKFDPHVHHAVEMVTTAEADDQTILAQLQRGYNFKGRLLRPALVKVAVKK